MRLYYTTTTGFNAEQSTPSNSLGGYKSATLVPNDVFDNLFDEVSVYGMSQAKTQYRALVLVNELNTVVNDVALWFDLSKVKTPYYSFLIGAIKMSADSEGNPIMENVPTIYSRPFQTQLYPATVDAKVTIGNIEPQQMIGLWFAKVPDKEMMMLDYNNVAEKIPNAVYYSSRYKPVEKEKEESIDFQISWT